MRIAYVKGQEFCDVLCFLEDNCFSYNFMTISETGKQKCELNNATHEGHERDLKKDMDYEYYAAEVWSLLIGSYPSMLQTFLNQSLSIILFTESY